MPNQNQFWRAIERLNGGAVIWEWSRELGGNPKPARPFLRVGHDPAKAYPCMNVAGCGCPHRVEEHGRGRWVAVCDPEEWCAPFTVTAAELVIYELDRAAFCTRAAQALGLSPTKSRKEVGTWVSQLGSFGHSSIRAYLMFPSDKASMAREVERLICSVIDPFVLFTATEIHCSREIESALLRHGSMHLLLVDMLAVTADGDLVSTKNIQPLLEQFERRLSEGKGLVSAYLRVDKNLELMKREQHELRLAKAELEKMRGEGLFSFVEKIDHESFKVMCAILAHGDVAKASRALGEKDSTVRTRIDSWKQRGPAYGVLREFVRWRKSVGRREKVNLPEELFKAQSPDTDYAGLLSDVLDELLSFDGDNWEEKCEELAGLIRPYVPR